MEDGAIVPLDPNGSRSEVCRSDGATAARLFADWFASLSGPTRQNYGQDLDAFAAFLGVPSRKEAAIRLCSSPSLEARDLALNFRTRLREAGAAPGTINRRLSALRSLVRHATGQPLIVPSLKAVRRRKVQRGNSSIVARLLSVAVEREGIKGLRDSALVLTLHDSGLRRAEVATLRVGDVDLEGRVAQVVGKGRQGEREAVDLSEPAAVAIRAYLGARGSLLPDAPLFCNADRAGKGTGGLSADGIRVVLAVLSRRAGLTQAVAPHDLRRQGAYALAKAGADAEMLRRWGRWSDYRVAARYVGEVEERGRAAVDLLAGLRQAVG